MEPFLVIIFYKFFKNPYFIEAIAIQINFSSGVVTTLFGPGGLDVPTLISSGTSLLAGLLSGSDNFGKVLGSYLGLALEGFTNGGGAVWFSFK